MASLATPDPPRRVVEGMPLPSELTPEQYTFQATSTTSTTTATQASNAFEKVGLVKIQNLIPRELSLQALQEAQSSFDELFAAMKERNVELQQGTKGGYAEIVQRSEGRYEMNYKMTTGIFANPIFTNNAWLQTFMNNILGESTTKEDTNTGTKTETETETETIEWELNRRSLLISFPDAKGQQWHVDGDHRTKSTHSSAHAINVFIALGDITLDMGPTEFRPCSHFLSRKLFKFMMLARARKQLHAPVQPVASSGDAVIFDYRTLHRGTENNSQLPRAMLELVFFKKGYTDLLNFPKRSIFKNVKKTNNNESEVEKEETKKAVVVPAVCIEDR